MPLLSTRGAASAKAFGWTRTLGGAGFAFMGQQSNNSSSLRGGASPASMTTLSTQPSSSTLKAIGLVVDGNFIAQAGNQYSLNGGASWNGWASTGGYTPTSMPPGVNGSIAYNPTSKRAYFYASEYNYKGNSFYAIVYTATSTGSTSQPGGPNFGSNTGAYNVLYSPANDLFYIANFGSSNTTWWSANGTSGGGGSNVGGSPCGNMRAGISHNGYPLQVAYAGFGSTFYLREYTSGDLSSYTQYGTYSGADQGGAAQSPFFWAPVNNKYIKAVGQSNGAALTIYTATSGSPASYSFLATVAIGAAGVVSANFIEQTNGTLWVFGLMSIDIGKGQRANTSYTWYSADGGSTWSQGPIGYFALAKNFTP